MGAENGEKKAWAERARVNRTVSKRRGAGTRKNRLARAARARQEGRNRPAVAEAETENA